MPWRRSGEVLQLLLPLLQSSAVPRGLNRMAPGRWSMRRRTPSNLAASKSAAGIGCEEEEEEERGTAMREEGEDVAAAEGGSDVGAWKRERCAASAGRCSVGA